MAPMLWRVARISHRHMCDMLACRHSTFTAFRRLLRGCAPACTLQPEESFKNESGVQEALEDLSEEVFGGSSHASSCYDQYVARHKLVRRELEPFQAALGAGPRPARRAVFSRLWGDELPSLRIDWTKWSAILQKLHAECASWEDLQRYIALPACPGGFLLALHYLRQRLALIKGPDRLIEQRSFRDLQARVPGEVKCTTTVRSTGQFAQPSSLCFALLCVAASTT